MIKNLLFDFGNVLIDINIPATESALADITGSAMPEVQKLLESGWHDQYECGKIQEESFFNAIQRCCNPVPQGKTLIDAWNAMLIGIPAARINGLKALRLQYGVYMLSNTNTSHLRWVHHHLKMQHPGVDFESACFDQVFYSHKIGFRKPDAASFQFVLDKAGIKASETLFIDDVIANTDAASALGFHVYHHNPQDEIMDILPGVIGMK